MANKSKKSIDEQKFETLSKAEQIAELRKLTKRANVRLALLEEKNSINLAYREAYQYNINLDRDKNRFYEGTKYLRNSEIKQAFNAVSNFLNNKSSTLSGVQDSIKVQAQEMIATGNINATAIKKMSFQEKVYFSKYLAQASNAKLSTLEKNKITQYAYSMAEYFNKDLDGRKNNRFYRGIKFKSEEDLNRQIEEMAHFFNAKTSTVEGYKQTITDRLDSFKEQGVNIPKDREKEFFDFLSTELFKKVGAKMDSNQAIKIFNEARDKKEEVEYINEAFREYLDGILDPDEVQERLKVGRYRMITD